jgi:hypothetical protein
MIVKVEYLRLAGEISRWAAARPALAFGALAVSVVSLAPGSAFGQAGTLASFEEIAAGTGGFIGPNNGSFGDSVANLGDLDGDGTVDIAVGASGDDDGGESAGAVWILFLDTDGTVKSEQKISALEGGFGGVLAPIDHFGADVVSLGDLDGDGVGDLAVGASGDNDGGVSRGAVWILFLDPDGTVKDEQKISATAGGFGGVLTNDSQFGSAVEGLGDLDGDGITDLAVGARGDDDGGNAKGAVWILFLHANGTVKSEQKISSTSGGLDADLRDGDRFGGALANLGDLDGDGIVDLAVGIPSSDTGGSTLDGNVGAVAILFMETDGTVRATQKVGPAWGNFVHHGFPLGDGDYFGEGLAPLGDIDGDGVVDLAVGASESGGSFGNGEVWVLLLNRNGTVRWEHSIPEFFSPLYSLLTGEDRFGIGLDAIGDLDGNGTVDLAVGSPNARMFTLFLHTPTQVRCGAVPAAGCQSAGKSTLAIGDRNGERRDFIKWKWKKGAGVTQTDLGDPLSDTSYVWCIYDAAAGVPALVGELAITPNDNWTNKSPKGFHFGDRLVRMGGLRQLKMRTGDSGKASVQMRAFGEQLVLPLEAGGGAYFDADSAVTVQLVNGDSLCWESSFASFKVNTPEKVKASAP